MRTLETITKRLQGLAIEYCHENAELYENVNGTVYFEEDGNVYESDFYATQTVLYAGKPDTYDSPSESPELEFEIQDMIIRRYES